MDSDPPANAGAACTIWTEWLAQWEKLDTRVQRLDAAIQQAMPEHPLSPFMLAVFDYGRHVRGGGR